MPTVSVIMPAYNAETYLPTAVESVLRQSLSDLELLIIDDGSSDGTLAIARGYAARDARVRVLAQANSGPGPARNAAFRCATGRFFAFLDSDDEWDESFLQENVGVLDRPPRRRRRRRQRAQPWRPARWAAVAAGVRRRPR